MCKPDVSEVYTDVIKRNKDLMVPLNKGNSVHTVISCPSLSAILLYLMKIAKNYHRCCKKATTTTTKNRPACAY